MANEEVKIVLTARDKTKQAFNSVRSGLGKVKSAAFSVKGALVSLGAGAAISKMASEIDNLGKTSRKLGIAAEELQGLRYAAQLSGVETNTLDMAMQRFTRRLAEARNGTGEAKSALEEMNVSIKNSDGSARSQTEVLGDVADAMAGIKDPSDKVRLAFKLFDAEGVSMVNMLDQGKAALEGVTSGFDAMGLALSEEQIARVEKANDRFSVLWEILKGIGNAIHVNVIVPIQNFITSGVALFLEGIAGMIKGLQSLANALGSDIDWSDTINSLNAMSSQLRGTSNELITVTAGVGGLNTVVKEAAEDWEDYDSALQKFSDSSKDLRTSLEDGAMRGLQGMEDSMLDLIKGTNDVKSSFKNMAASIIDDLIRIQIQQSITKPLAGLLGTAIGGISAASTYGTNIGSEQTAMLAAQDAGFKALGGSVQAGKAYTVGEHGRETFIPNTNGTILPNGADGGVTINQTIQISTGVAQTVRAEIQNLMPQITNATKAAVADARQRGGGYSKALVGA